jgi:lipid II:glycine glycyltransferase (peptidoglycan interpeptide bridge formation enzyme)
MTDKQRYIQICEEKKHYIPLFSQHWWLDAVCAEWDVAIVKKGEQVTGAWPYPVEKKAGITLLRTPMLTPYMGPQVFYPHDLKEANRDNFEHDTVSALMKQLPDAKVWHLALHPSVKQAGIFKNNGLRTQVQQTFLIDLAEPEETLLGNMKDTMRRNIRAAEKDLVITNSPEQLADLYNFQSHTLGKKGRRQAWSLKYINGIMNACLAHNAAALWVAKSGEQIQAVVWHVWDERCSYYLAGAQNPEAAGSNALSLLLWNAMKEAKKSGNTAFDLEGSMDEGVERFFRSFGGQRTLYLVLMKNKSLLWKMKELIRG